MPVDISKAIDETFPNFKFRENQREVIEYVLNTYQESPETQIVIDAPTGTGKSIITMFSALILNKYFKKDGYILTADTSLQDQYERDSQEFNFEYPAIKGLDKYTCGVNFQPTSAGDCKIRGLSGKKIKKLECYSSCEYYTNRDNAIAAQTSILNYNYWLMQMTHVNATIKEEHQNFPVRDFTFFDEAHNVVNIVSEHFTPSFKLDFVERINPLLLYGIRCGVYGNKEYLELKKVLSQILVSIKNRTRHEKVIDDLKQIYPHLKVLNKVANILTNDNERMSVTDDGIPEENKKAIKNIKSFKNFYKTTTNYYRMVKEDPERLIHKQYDENSNTVKLYCSDESMIMKKYFHNYHNFGVYLSATFLNHNFFKEYAGIGKYKKILVPSTFDYSKSPIYFSNKFSMSFANRDSNIEAQIQKIDEIVDKYPSGVIHTASKRNAQDLIKFSRHRDKIVTYEDTNEKNVLLLRLKNKKDFFLAGPSLLEGIDLKGDISRCQIFMKVPFPNLGDSFVKRRLEMDQLWYNWLTALNFVQGLGRSMRKEDDYCDTYILDNAFNRILRTGLLPIEVSKRVKFL